MGWIADLLKEIPSAARYKAELETMKEENASLKLQVSDLRQEIQRRDDEVQKEKSHGQRLEEVREKILLLLAKSGGSTVTEISKSINIEVQLAKFHLNELLATEFVHHPAPYAASERWGIEQEGRRYLVSHGLL